jgi:hypothetical protein
MSRYEVFSPFSGFGWILDGSKIAIGFDDDEMFGYERW